MMAYRILESTMSRPATKADLDAALRRQFWQITAAFGIMLVLAFALGGPFLAGAR
jgi:hypothetical protein